MQVIVICENDKAVRQHLATLAKAMKAKFSTTAYQGDYVNEYTTETFGDRVQTGTQRTINGVRYLFVLNVGVDRNKGGKTWVRVSAWHLDEVGRVAGTWAVARTYIGADKKLKANGVFLTGNGWHRHLAGKNVATTADGVATRIFPFMEQAVEVIKASLSSDLVSPGRPVQLVHGYSPSNPLYGETYETGESHLLVFGGYDGAGQRLAR
jgi:hypothetical protein